VLAKEVKTVECSAGGAGRTLIETEVGGWGPLECGSSGRQRNGWTAVKRLREGGSSMMRRQSMESGSDGLNSRLTETMGRTSGRGLGCTMRWGKCGRTGREREEFRFRENVAVGLQDCGVGVDNVMRDGAGIEAGARCVRTRTNAAGFDARYGGPTCARCRSMSSSTRNSE
jgi:hypothetical protein